MELHIGAYVTLAGGKIAGIVLNYRGRIANIRTANGNLRIQIRDIESIQESA